ncbi:HU family DNA-binding protein [Odoribacter splanchnicus]|uniref:HU family DNA-binding protein n=1 Tax=Odoribacter splanchnicus TaxID=28118 RepID=UPI0034B5C877
MAGTAMKIRWVLRHNPQNRLLPPKYYAAPVFAGRRDAGEMIRQIADRSVLSAGDIVDAFANAGELAADWLAAGCSVELPEIGSLLLEFSSEGLDDPADFRPGSLRGVRLRFYPSRQLMKAIKSQLNISLPE